MDDRPARSFRPKDSRERRMDQWLETGRQLVDGVAGRRPGQRRSSLDLDSVGRWVGDRIDWLLDDDEDWQEPWQEDRETDLLNGGGKRPLDAISRRVPQRSRPLQPQSTPLGSPQQSSELQQPLSQQPSSQQPSPPADQASRSRDDPDAWPDDDDRTRLVFVTRQIERKTLELFFNEWLKTEPRILQAG